MAPPTQPLNLDVEAISGICGSISIACWVVVFSPQIVENFRRSSADGLSLQFIIVWLLGDVFNILGAVLQGVLPTMIILAVYYTIADIVLLGQCFYYRGFTWRDEVIPPVPKPATGNGGSSAGRGHPGEPDERTGLLAGTYNTHYHGGSGDDRRSSWSSQSHHLSPAVPLLAGEPLPPIQVASSSSSPPAPSHRTTTRLQAFTFNLCVVLMVCASGVAGWYLSRPRSPTGGDNPPSAGPRPGNDDSSSSLEFSLWGQVFGWLCAVLYLGSRVPQLLLNWRRKSTEGVSVLFFLFACLGNLTYVLSIFAFEPHCSRRGAQGVAAAAISDGHQPQPTCESGEAARIYWQYMLVNLSWLAGSLGTLLLDMAIFVQFFIYSTDEEDDGSEEGVDDDGYLNSNAVVDEEDDSTTDGESIDEERWDPRPILQRNMSNWSQ